MGADWLVVGGGWTLTEWMGQKKRPEETAEEEWKEDVRRLLKEAGVTGAKSVASTVKIAEKAGCDSVVDFVDLFRAGKFNGKLSDIVEHRLREHFDRRGGGPPPTADADSSPSPLPVAAAAAQKDDVEVVDDFFVEPEAKGGSNRVRFGVRRKDMQNVALKKYTSRREADRVTTLMQRLMGGGCRVVALAKDAPVEHKASVFVVFLRFRKTLRNVIVGRKGRPIAENKPLIIGVRGEGGGRERTRGKG